MKDLVAAAVKGAELCMVALDVVAERKDSGDVNATTVFRTSSNRATTGDTNAEDTAAAAAASPSEDDVFFDMDLLAEDDSLLPSAAADEDGTSVALADIDENGGGGKAMVKVNPLLSHSRYGSAASLRSNSPVAGVLVAADELLADELLADDAADDNDDDDDDDDNDDEPASATRINEASTAAFKMSERRSVAHAVLDALAGSNVRV